MIGDRYPLHYRSEVDADAHGLFAHLDSGLRSVVHSAHDHRCGGGDRWRRRIMKRSQDSDRGLAIAPRLTSEPHDVTPVLLPGSQVFLIPGAYYIAHVLEELPGFADWSSRHFSPMTSSTFATFDCRCSLYFSFYINRSSISGMVSGS